MNNKKLSQLEPAFSLSDDDLIFVTSDGLSKSTTIANLRAQIASKDIIRPATPALPPGPSAINGPITDLATPGIPINGDATATSLAITNALASGGTCILEGGETYNIAYAPLRTSGSRLLRRGGAHAVLRLADGFSGGADNTHNAGLSNVSGASDFTVYGIAVDVRNIGAGSNSTRINGIKNFGAKRVRMQECVVRNVSGYGCFDQYASISNDCTDILWDRCGAVDASYAFEQMDANSYLLDCWADTAVATATTQHGGVIHPVGSSNVTVVRLTARGFYSRTFYILIDRGLTAERIYIQDSDINILGTSANFEVQELQGGKLNELIIINSRFKAKAGARISAVMDGRIYASSFEADAVGNVEAFNVIGATTKISMDDASRIIGKSTTNAFGLGIHTLGAEVYFDGEVITQHGAGSASYPVSGVGLPGLTVGSNARFLPGPLNVENDLLDHSPEHINSTLQFVNATNQTYRLNAANGNYTPPTSAKVYLQKVGAGNITVSVGAGVTLYAPNGAILDQPLQKAELVASGPNAWTLAKETSTSAPPAVDETPDAFTFIDVTNVVTSSEQTSNQITVSGIGSGVSVPISITGGTYSKNEGAYTSAAGTAINGDTFRVRHTASSASSTAVNTVLTIGGISDTFTSTTAAAPAGPVELVTNGTFNTDTSGWVDENAPGQAISWDPSGKLKMTVVPGSGGYGSAMQQIAIAGGKTYRFRANMSTPNTKMRVRIINTDNVPITWDQGTNPSGVIDENIVVPAGGTGNFIIHLAAADIGAFAGDNETALFDNISLIEV